MKRQSKMIRVKNLSLGGLWWMGILWVFQTVHAAAPEPAYPPEAMAKLDTFEAVNLEDADKLYAKGDFKGAFASYKAYSFEFAKSKAMPYVLLRMGRCLHRLEKRNAAIEAYKDVVDYFPDDVRHAAAALYYIGECHAQNGDEAKQTAVWARMVQDNDYVNQPNSGTALAFLGKEMEKLGKFEEAASYHWRTAVAFQKANPDAASTARASVLAHYVRRSPNHDKLKEFYVAASGFDGQGRNTEKPEDDPRYWSKVLETAMDTRTEAAVRESACAYWVVKMGSRFEDQDDLRKKWLDAQLVTDKNKESWVAGLEKQYKAKPASMDRIFQWCKYLEPVPKVRSEFFTRESKSLLAGTAVKDKMDLVRQLGSIRMHDEAQAVLRSISPQGLSDEELVRLSSLIANYETEDAVLRSLSRIKDPLVATKARFDYYMERSHRNRPYMEKALAEIPALKKSPAHAGEKLTWAEATLYQGLGRHEEAIKAFREANRQPDSTWEIKNCLVAMKQYPKAIQTMRELEGVGGNIAAKASLEIANIHRAAGDKSREVDQLRLVLKRYPKSGESSEAHHRLESYGVALIGGESEATD